MFLRTDLEPLWSPVINEWIDSQGGGRAAEGSYTALGYFLDGRIVGGIVFACSNGASCTANIAIAPGWNPRPIIRAGLTYAFDQLGLRRLTFYVSPANIHSIKLITGLGAMHEATLREAMPEGDLHIYALFPENSSIWSRIRGKRFKSAAVA